MPIAGWRPIGQVIAATLGDRYTDRNKQVNTLRRLVDEISEHRGLLTREVFVCRDGLRILHNTINSRLLPAAEYFRSSPAEVGIALDINSFDFATYIQKIYTERAFDLDVQTLVNGYDPTDGIQRAYWSKNIKQGLPWSNQTHYSNPEVDDILQGSGRTQ